MMFREALLVPFEKYFSLASAQTFLRGKKRERDLDVVIKLQEWFFNAFSGFENHCQYKLLLSSGWKEVLLILDSCLKYNCSSKYISIYNVNFVYISFNNDI